MSIPDSAPIAPIRPSTASFGTAAGFVALAGLMAMAVLVTLWGVLPELAGFPLPESAARTVAGLFFGSRFSGLMTALVFDVAAALGTASFLSTIRLLAREEAALGQAKAADKRGVDVGALGLTGSQSPFFFAGAESIADLQKSAVYAMSENILKDARSYRYEPVAMIIERVAPQIVAGSLNLRDAQQMGIRLGILGTFVGMTLALVKITGVFAAAGNANASQAAVGQVIESLSLGFGTSVAGLFAAILLQIMAWGLRDRENAVLAEMQEAAAGMQALCRKAEMRGSIGTDIERLKEALDEHRHKLDAQGMLVSESGQKLLDASHALAHVFTDPLDRIRATGERLSGLLADQHGAVAALAETTRQVAALQDSVAGHVERSMERASLVQRETTEALRQEVRLLSGAIAAEMQAGFESSRGLERAGDLAAQLARAAAMMEAAASAQRRAAGRTTLVLGVLLVLVVVVGGLFYIGWSGGAAQMAAAGPDAAIPDTAIPDIAHPDVASTAAARPAAADPSKGVRP